MDDDSDPDSVQDTLLNKENRESHEEKPKKKIKLEKNKMSTDDEDDDFDTACQESIDQYIKQDRRTETYFKFENGMIIRLSHPPKTTKTSPNCIVLSEKTLEDVNVSDDLTWVFNDYHFSSDVIFNGQDKIDLSINRKSIYNKAYDINCLQLSNSYISEARAPSKIYDAVYPVSNMQDRYALSGTYTSYIHCPPTIPSYIHPNYWSSQEKRKRVEAKREHSSFLF